MTKAKKKMNKSTFVIIIMAVAMVALLAFGGTFAYFTATAKEVTATATTGTISINAGETASITSVKSNVLPGESVFEDNASFTYNFSSANRNMYVFITFDVKATDTSDQAISDLASLSVTVADNDANITALDGYTGVYYFEAKVEDENYQSPNILAGVQVTLPTSLAADWVEGEAQPALMGATITITITARAIQSATFSSATAAYEALNPTTPETAG